MIASSLKPLMDTNRPRVLSRLEPTAPSRSRKSFKSHGCCRSFCLQEERIAAVCKRTVDLFASPSKRARGLNSKEGEQVVEN